MSESHQRADWPIVVTLVLVLLLAMLGVYFGCYFAMSDLSPSLGSSGLSEKPGLVRSYNATWKATLFKPAAKVESLVRGRRVDTLAFEGWQAFDAWKN